MSDHQVPSAANKKKRYGARYGLALLYVNAGIWGVVQLVSPTHGFIILISTTLFTSSATYAAVEDANRLGHPIPHIVQLLYFLTWPLASFVYLVARRGWRGIAIWLLIAASLYVTALAAFFSTWTILSVLGWTPPVA